MRCLFCCIHMQYSLFTSVCLHLSVYLFYLTPDGFFFLFHLGWCNFLCNPWKVYHFLFFLLSCSQLCMLIHYPWKYKKLSLSFSVSLSLPLSLAVSVSVSAEDVIVVIGKAHTCSAPFLCCLPKVALETVPIFVWLNTDHFWPWRVEFWPLSFSTPLSVSRSMLWCCGLSMFRKLFKLRSFCPAKLQTRCDICCTCQSICLFIPLTLACPGQ